MDIMDISGQIKRNCDISDAQYWGYYSICGLLMRMRELFLHEHACKPWAPVPSEDISRWLTAREALWQDLEGQCLRDIDIAGSKFDPFDVDSINRLLEPLGYVYGGGLGTFHKPQFFLGQLQERREVYDYIIHSVGSELCRDLSFHPALLQGRCIYIRNDALVMLIWERFQAVKSRQVGSLLEEVFNRYGIDKESAASEGLSLALKKIIQAASDLFVLHEIGEAFEDDLSGEWLGIIGSGCDKFCELYLRGTKDLIADTSDMGPLRSIIQKQDEDLMLLYAALLDGIRKDLCPELMCAFREFQTTGDWHLIEKARKAGYQKAVDLRGAIVSSWRDRPDIARLSAILRNASGTKSC